MWTSITIVAVALAIGAFGHRWLAREAAIRSWYRERNQFSIYRGASGNAAPNFAARPTPAAEIPAPPAAEVLDARPVETGIPPAQHTRHSIGITVRDGGVFLEYDHSVPQAAADIVREAIACRPAPTESHIAVVDTDTGQMWVQ